MIEATIDDLGPTLKQGTVLIDRRTKQTDTPMLMFSVEQRIENTAADADTLRVTGDLTIKDVTQPVTIDFDYEGAAVDPYGNQRIGFEGRTKIARSDFGLTFNATLETGGVLVSDDVRISIEAEFTAPVPTITGMPAGLPHCST
mgnify:CR=1 FL=1